MPHSSSRSMSVSSEHELMHTGSNGTRACVRTWGPRALALMVGVAGVLVLVLLATGGDRGKGRSSSSSKPRFTGMRAGPSTVNDKGAIDNNGDATLPAGEMLSDDRPYITLFGDSHTQYSWNPAILGYASLLANTYTRWADIKNRGVSGYTTRDALRVLDSVFPLGKHSWVQAHPPVLVVILLGSNDQVPPGSWVEATTGEDHHVPLSEYKSNYKLILTHLRTLRKDLPLILVTPPPVADNAVVKEYGDAVLSLGKEEGLPVFDLWEACEGKEADKFPGYLVDGLHLNGKGNTVLFEGLMAVIGEHYPALLPEGEKMPKRERDPWEA